MCCLIEVPYSLFLSLRYTILYYSSLHLLFHYPHILIIPTLKGLESFGAFQSAQFEAWNIGIMEREWKLLWYNKVYLGVTVGNMGFKWGPESYPPIVSNCKAPIGSKTSTAPYDRQQLSSSQALETDVFEFSLLLTLDHRSSQNGNQHPLDCCKRRRNRAPQLAHRHALESKPSNHKP